MDCKDYAVHNAELIRSWNETPQYVLTPKEHPNHIFVMFKRGDVIYVLNNDRMYSTSLQGHLPVEERP